MSDKYMEINCDIVYQQSFILKIRLGINHSAGVAQPDTLPALLSP
jgi:hypothetical protein